MGTSISGIALELIEPVGDELIEVEDALGIPKRIRIDNLLGAQNSEVAFGADPGSIQVTIPADAWNVNKKIISVMLNFDVLTFTPSILPSGTLKVNGTTIFSITGSGTVSNGTHQISAYLKLIRKDVTTLVCVPTWNLPTTTNTGWTLPIYTEIAFNPSGANILLLEGGTTIDPDSKIARFISAEWT